VAEPFIRSLFAAAVGRVAVRLLDADRPEQREVERERALDVGDREVDVMDCLDGHGEGCS
jgi:hypothetical protein